MAPDSSTLRVQPREGQARMAWRNGGGETRELSVWPRGAGLDAFEWRVSVATIALDGPFSRYPGSTRTAVLLDGGGVRLAGGPLRIELAERFAQATFDGAPAWECELMEGPVQVFNVMVGASFLADVRVIRNAAYAIEPAPHRLAYAARGRSAIALGGAVADLAHGDACHVESPGLELRVEPQGDACLIVASIHVADPS